LEGRFGHVETQWLLSFRQALSSASLGSIATTLDPTVRWAQPTGKEAAVVRFSRAFVLDTVTPQQHVLGPAQRAAVADDRRAREFEPCAIEPGYQPEVGRCGVGVIKWALQAMDPSLQRE
jgi:hypothetical protein